MADIVEKYGLSKKNYHVTALIYAWETTYPTILKWTI